MSRSSERGEDPRPWLRAMARRPRAPAYSVLVSWWRRIGSVELRWERPLATPCGIYFLIAQGSLVYVGRTTDWTVRSSSHAADGKRWDEAHILTADADDSWHRFGDDRLYAQIENTIIQAVNPPRNVRREVVSWWIREMWEERLGIREMRGWEALLRWLLS